MLKHTTSIITIIITTTTTTVLVCVSVQGLIKLNIVPVIVSKAVSTSYLAYYLAPVLSLCYLFSVAFVQAWPAIPSKSSGKLIVNVVCPS